MDCDETTASCSSNDAAAGCYPHGAIRHSRGPWNSGFVVSMRISRMLKTSMNQIEDQVDVRSSHVGGYAVLQFGAGLARVRGNLCFLNKSNCAGISLIR
jgi:hypothetical protein